MDLGIKCKSNNYWLGGNSRLAKIIRGKEAKAQRRAGQLGALYLIRTEQAPALPPILATLTRIMGPGQRRFDKDNLDSGYKHVRDGIADAYGIDDRESELVQWEYKQERGEKATTLVTIEELGSEKEPHEAAG